MKNTSLQVFSSDSGLDKYLKKINKIASLSQEEEFLLAKNYLEQRDLNAAEKLVTSHLKLVAKIAVSYKNYGLPIIELISEGNIGLMQAVKKYNPDLGFRLSTYAMWWIKASIQEYILKSWSLVKIGTTSSQKKLFFSLSKVKNKIMNTYSRQINDNDLVNIAKNFGMSAQDIREMNTRLIGGDLSLNNTVGGDSNEELIEFLPETRANQEIYLMNKEDFINKQKKLHNAMKLLNSRELEILISRKLTEPAKTLDELSIKYKISKERVRQIENKAFEKIQASILLSIDNQKSNKANQYNGAP